MLEVENIRYDTPYNTLFRPITNTQITTVEISPTGSGKTYFYKNSPYTIMLMPTNSLVRQNGGLLAKDKAEDGERSRWDEIRTDRCEYMTYHKFAGHMKREDISNFNIIIDEAHLLLGSIDEIYHELINTLLMRKINYKELKLISATLRTEVLDMYNRNIAEMDSNYAGLSVKRYIDTNKNIRIIFTTQIPKIEIGKKTLFFINSKDKMIQIEEYYKEHYSEVRVTKLSADENEKPSEEKFENHDLILSTSVIKQGYSIATKIDRVIVHNVYNAVGAIEIIQYIARPRNGNPEVYVISSRGHFSIDDLQVPSIEAIENTIKGYQQSESKLAANYALKINKLAAYTKRYRNRWNRPAMVYYYEEMMTYYELNSAYCEVYSFGMQDSMVGLMPNTEILYENSEEIDDIRFRLTRLELNYEDYADLEALRDELLIIIQESDDEKIINKAKKYLKIEPIVEYTNNDKNEPTIYNVTDAIQIRQVLEPKVLERCEQHKLNLENNVYQLRDKGDQRNRLQIGETCLVSKLGRKLESFKRMFNNQIEPLELAQRMYSFKKYSDVECTRELSEGRMVGVMAIVITSMYTVEDDWLEIDEEKTHEARVLHKFM